MAHLLGNTIRSCREKKGCSLHSLAKQVGCSHVYLWKLERGKTFTEDLSTLRKIASALDLDEHQQEDLLDAASKSQRVQKYSAALTPLAYEVASLVRSIVETKTDAQLLAIKAHLLAATINESEVPM